MRRGTKKPIFIYVTKMSQKRIYVIFLNCFIIPVLHSASHSRGTQASTCLLWKGHRASCSISYFGACSVEGEVWMAMPVWLVSRNEGGNTHLKLPRTSWLNGIEWSHRDHTMTCRFSHSECRPRTRRRAHRSNQCLRRHNYRNCLDRTPDRGKNRETSVWRILGRQIEREVHRAEFPGECYQKVGWLVYFL